MYRVYNPKGEFIQAFYSIRVALKLSRKIDGFVMLATSTGLDRIFDVVGC